MTVSLTTPEMIVNEGLAKIGYPGRINNIYEGTPQAKKALDVFAQERDFLMCKNDWDFCQKISALVASGGTAPAPYSNEWTYPSDALKIRQLFQSTAYTSPYNNPIPVLYKLGTAAAGKVIWTQVASCTAVYTSQVIPIAQWDASFIEQLANLVGKTLGPALQKLEAIKIVDEDLKEGAERAMTAPE